ncbi:heme oxygenase 1, chloroplastic-like [Gastrolobium bilobum]|uniref:heme oxygenase 1, chloroplastic-like n=1 Tax=Gastrolobium bilobum TaxID=150636 RepID=UPI002AB2EF93|nr:heme oxygenase 1, chloroplastic-like [Gastrolobium bilobum]
MASLTAVSQIQSLYIKTHVSSPNHQFRPIFLPSRLSVKFQVHRGVFGMPMKKAVIVSATTAEKPKKRYPGESKGFVEEMRFVAMKLHTKDQAKEGEKEVMEPEERAVTKWDPTIDGYIRFLVDSKLVYDTLEKIIEEAAYPS